MNKINTFRRCTEVLIILLLFQAHVENMLIAYIGLLMIMSFTYFKEFYKKIDNIAWIFILLIIGFIMSLLFNFMSVIEYTGYFKIILNGAVWLFLAMYGFTFGITIRDMSEQIEKIIRFIIFIFLINACVIIYVWYTTTGGVIGRYNFISPITMNVSAGINLSSLGFFLSLENVNAKKIIYWFYPIIFAINIAIIVTRKEQILFCLYLICYIFLKIKSKKSLTTKVVMLFNLPFIGVALFWLFQRLFIATYSKYYINFFSETGYDMMVRENAKQAALNMFYDNPIFGCGYGFFELNNSYLTDLASAHNGAFSILAEWGIFGALVACALGILIVKASFKAIKGDKIKTKYNTVLSIFLMSSVFTSLIANTYLLPPPSERIYYLYGIIMWMAFGMIRGRVDVKVISKI